MKQPIVFDNIIYNLQKAGGISAFWSQLTSRIAATGDFECFYIEYPGASDNIFRKELELPASNIIKGKHLPFGIERLCEPWIPAKLLRRPFIFHSSYYRTFTHPLAANVSTFHDLTHELGGDGNMLTRSLMRMLHKRAIKSSGEIVCVSKNTLTDIQRFFPDSSSKRISVAYNAPVITSQSGNANGQGYLLYMGARDPYKHFDTAVEIAAASGIAMKVIGAPFTAAENKMITRRNATVTLIPYADALTSAKLYSGALCLLYLSEYEGFGIPIAEAQNYGCPVMTLRKSAIPEIAGEGAIYIDKPEAAEAIAALERLRNTEFRTELIARGRANAERFSWDTTARHYAAVYRKLLREKSRQR